MNTKLSKACGLILASSSLLLSACGSDSDDSSPTAPVNNGSGGADSGDNGSTPPVKVETGKLDLPIRGLRYQTATQQGITDPDGTFSYVAGEQIRFDFADYQLSSVDAAAEIAFTQLTQSRYRRDSASVQLLVALIAADTDGDMYNGITIEDTATTSDSRFNAIDNEQYQTLAGDYRAASAYALLDWLEAGSTIQMAAANHHTLGLSNTGRPFSFGENYSGTIRGEDPNRYCNGQHRNKLGRPSDTQLNPGDELVTEPKEGLTEAEGNCYITSTNERKYSGYNPTSQWVDVDADIVFKRISSDQTDGVMVTEDGRLFVFGPNNSGQLGLGHENPVTTPVEVTLPNDEQAVYATTASASSYVITRSGKVLSAGDNGNLQLGRVDDKNADQATFGEVIFPQQERIVALATRDHHVYALTAAGDVYSWGNNSSGGELGDGTTKTDRSQPARILADENIIAVETGADFGFAVSAAGKVFGWGDNRFGSMAQGTPVANSANTIYSISDIGELLQPAELTNLSPENLGGDRIIAFQGGSRNAQALTLQGDVYSWGDMGTGYMGNGYAVDDKGIERQLALDPVKVAALDDVNVVQLSANTSSHFAVTDDGQVYAWGSTADGRLSVAQAHCDADNQQEYGQDVPASVCYKPLLVNPLPQQAGTE